MMFADNWFDAVMAFETVYFWPDLPRCFREVWRVLKPGGTFFICNESNGDTDRDEKWTKIINGMTIYQGTELKAYLEQAGSSKVYRCSTSVYSESRRDRKSQHSAMLICPLSFTCA